MKVSIRKTTIDTHTIMIILMVHIDQLQYRNKSMPFTFNLKQSIEFEGIMLANFLAITAIELMRIRCRSTEWEKNLNKSQKISIAIY